MKTRNLLTVAGVVLLAACGDASTPMDVSELDLMLARGGKNNTVVVDTSRFDDCRTDIAAVQVALDGINDGGRIGGGNAARTYASLSSKLQAALTKLDEDKPVDAFQKLTDFQSAVTSMRDAAKPKLSAEDADVLLAGVSAALDCVFVFLPVE